jgi:ferredoxin--NADP+ reductase
VFVATGTGEAPHNAMIAQLLAAGHRGRIVAVTCVRYRRDLAYLSAHRTLQAMFANYQYVPLTTREPENLEPCVADYVGKRYVQDYFRSGDFERDTGLALRPDRLHVFLCGNPRMIGAPRREAGGTAALQRLPGMSEVLAERGFTLDQPGALGNIHAERYW